MLLRPRQKVFVERSRRALDRHGNTLGVAPTGAGKTIMLAANVGEQIGDAGKAAVLAHRDELTVQNRAKFLRVVPGISTSVVDASTKGWNGQVTFAMVPTLARPANLDAMPTLDLLVVDEAHHAAADSYRRIIDRALRRNPACRIFGVTATPNRGDGRGLRGVFSNVADQIRLGEMVRSGHLVQPKTFVVDVGVREELRAVRRSGDDFDMAEVSRVMNTPPVTEAVIAHWREKAGARQTVMFCSTVEHAAAVAAAFEASGVPTVLVTGGMPDNERRAALAGYAAGRAQVVVNVAVLTEGWDHPPTSCVVLLRPSSFKSTMIQMVGRGLRTVDPEEHPGGVKTDCIVLDFGTSSLLHGSLEQDVDLDGRAAGGEAPAKTCPACEGSIPLAASECPLCGHAFKVAGGPAAVPLSDFAMREIDLLRRSSFAWCDLFGDDAALVANGFHGWGGIFFLNGRWYAVGGGHGERTRLLAVGERLVCLAAADDWLNAHLPEQLIDLLLAEMEAGRLGAGDRLKEEELAQRHAVSRATVREALVALAKQGHVVRTPRSGARVAEFSRQDLDDLFDLRAALLAFAAGRCARRGGCGRSAELGALVARLEAMAEDPASEPQAFAAQSVRAQALLVEWSGNRHLADAYERLAGIGAWQMIRGRSTSFLTADGRRQSASDWRRLAGRIAEGDAAGSERAARRLLEHSAERVRRHLDGAARQTRDA